MTTIAELPTSSLLLDLDVLERNLQRMADQAFALGIELRPHIKTHKCIEVAERQRQLGIAGITVATLNEAEVFADHGFDDITWAFPLILNRLAQARKLAARVVLRLVIDSRQALEAMEATGSQTEGGAPLHVWLKVDCGYHRAGVDPSSASTLELARAIANSPFLTFDGLLTHSGHAYHGSSREEITAIGEQERRVMVELAQKLRAGGIEVPGVSVGSTPTMAAVESLEGVTEARPGNYALYDYMQHVLGSCGAEDCAATVLASVISCQSDHCIVDAGALSLSKDPGPEQAPRPTMGMIFSDYRAGTLDPEAYLVSLSQEHGLVSKPLPVGTRVRILPNHSCLTVACFDEYQVIRGEKLIDTWKVWRGR
ncbi:MAG: alanine racemase [Acidobacteriota bacterium]